MKLTHALVPLIILLAFAGCGPGSPDDTAIPGITPRDVYQDLPNRGMALSEFWDHVTFRTSLGMEYEGIAYRLEIIGRNRSSVDSICATVEVRSARADAQQGRRFLRRIAAVAYEGSNPDRVAQWISEHINERENRTVIGPVEYILYTPTNNSRELILHRAKPSRAVGSHDCDRFRGAEVFADNRCTIR